MIYSIKSPASGAGNFGEPRSMSLGRESAPSRARVNQCFSAVRAVEVSSIGLLARQLKSRD